MITFRLMIIFYPMNEREVLPMAQRRAEKPKKMKISPKQQEFYKRFKSN